MPMNVYHVRPGTIFQLEDGDRFGLILPDGTQLVVEQDADYLSVVNQQGLVVYSRGTSAAGKHLFPFNASHLEN